MLPLACSTIRFLSISSPKINSFLSKAAGLEDCHSCRMSCMVLGGSVDLLAISNIFLVP